MSRIVKLLHLINRFFVVWRNDGFNTSLALVKAKVASSIKASTSKERSFDQIESNYREIYNSYLFPSQKEFSTEFEEFSAENLDPSNLPAKIIAFYLPQFHPIPENDLWWGKGFTEWTNVSRAVPNFVGHYQPRLPGELGYYDLRIPEIQRRQVELAKNYGIYGFCFHYYWFNGKRLLEKPLDQFINDPEINFPFCICWANENWTRRWDGRADDVLIAQEHSFESDKLIIHDIVKLFSHQHYIRINNRPLLIVYRANILQDVNLTVDYWRNYSIKFGTGDPYIVEAHTDGFVDPRKIGFDAEVEFPPNGVPPIPQGTHTVDITNPNFQGAVFEYKDIAEAMFKKAQPDYKVFKTVIPSWDNTPRRQNQSLIFTNSTPNLYKTWLEKAISFSLDYRSGDDNIVFVNAWNEWAECAYLEPDQKFGYAYLRATMDALQSFNNNDFHLPAPAGNQKLLRIEKKHETAVFLHLFYPDLWDEMCSYLKNLDNDFDLYVSVPRNQPLLKELIPIRYPDARIYQFENRGRDMSPFIQLFSICYPLNYQYICKIHTKKSKYSENGSNWRREILDELLGSASVIQQIKQKLDQDNIGIVGPYNNLLSTNDYLGGNEELIKELVRTLEIPFEDKPFTFIAGSMFWLKPAAIASILDLHLAEKDFPVEEGQRDATLAHALERFICFLAEYNGYKVIQTRDFTTNLSDEFTYATPSQ